MDSPENIEDTVEVGDWVKERILGSGGFGIVVLWKKKNSSEAIALKQCSWGHDALMTPKNKQRWKMEVDIMKRLSHPNVVKATEVPSVLDVPETELPLLAMEYCNGGDLRKVLNRPENCCGLSEKEVRNLVRQIASAVKYLHSQRIIHRDLKPENIVLQEADGKTVYKLIDLGYAKELDQGSLCTSFVGTLQYLAPELFMHNKYSCSVDYWSLGLVTHEVITGQRPFLPEMTPAQWIPYIKEKPSSKICACIDDDGKVILLNEITPYTRISDSLKKGIEEWLKVMLDWDPTKRGRSSDGTWSEILEKLLDKKFIQIFCTNSCNLLTYPIDENTTLKQLQLRMEKDTKIPCNEQELLLPKGLPVETNACAIESWTNPEEEESCIFLSSKNESFASEESKTPIPPLVERMMRNPRLTVEYGRQRLAWIQAVYLCTLERFRSFRLAYSYKANLNYFLSKISNMKKTSMARATEVIKMYSTHDFFRTRHICALRSAPRMKGIDMPENIILLLEKDLEIYKRQAKEEELVGAVVEMYLACFSGCKVFEASDKMEQKWQKSFSLSESLKNLQEKVKDVEIRTAKLNDKSLELQKSPYARLKFTDLTEEIYQKVLMAFRRLKIKPKDKRNIPADNTEMVQLLCAFLQQNDKRLEDIKEKLKLLRKTKQEIEELLPQLDLILEEVQTFSQQIENAQLQRQRDMWNLLELVIKKLKAPGQCILSNSEASQTMPSFSHPDYVFMQNSMTPPTSFMLDGYQIGPMIPRFSSLLSPHSSLLSSRESIAGQPASLSAIRERNANESIRVLEENYELREKMDSMLCSLSAKCKNLGVNPESRESEPSEDTENRTDLKK